MESSTAEIVSIPEGLGIISLMLLIMLSMLTNSWFCLSVIVITLRNCPRGESSRDVMVLNLMRLILQTEFANERLESPLIYNNLIAPDPPIRLRAPNRPEVSVQTDAERSNAAETGTETANKTSDTEEKDGPLGHVSASVEDSGENQPQTPRRRKRRKKKYDTAASQLLDSSSGDEHHHLLSRRMTQKRPGQSRSRTRRTLAGGKRSHGKWPGREGARKDAEEETLGLLKTRRMTQRPAHLGRSPSEEPVPGPSGKRLLKEKGKESQVHAAPSKESREASCKEPPTGRRKRTRPRKGDKDRTNPPGGSTTDSEEVVQPKPLRKRKTKDK